MCSFRWATPLVALLLGAPALVALTVAAPASANSSQMPEAFVARPLSLPGAVMRLDAGPRWPFYDSQFKHIVVDNGNDLDFLNPGISFGLTDDFELGLVYPIELSPDTRPRDPRVHILYRFEPGRTSYGLFAEVRLPADSDTTSVLAGVPVYHLFGGGDVRMETGGFALIDGIGRDSSLSVIAPISFSFQLSQRFYLGPEAGLGLYGLFEPGGGIATPVGGFLGYTLGSGAPLGDLYGRLRLTDIPDGALELMFGFEFFFDL